MAAAPTNAPLGILSEKRVDGLNARMEHRVGDERAVAKLFDQRGFAPLESLQNGEERGHELEGVHLDVRLLLLEILGGIESEGLVP